MNRITEDGTTLMRYSNSLDLSDKFQITLYQDGFSFSLESLSIRLRFILKFFSLHFITSFDFPIIMDLI